MKITKITLKNFRQFKDVELEIPKEKDLIVIVGKNGTGKTNFMNAISWCLFGKEIDVRKDSKYPLMNISTINELRIGDKEKVEVEIWVEKNNGEIYVLKRFQYFIKVDERTVEGDSNSILEIRYKPVNQDWIIVTSPNFVRNSSILTEDVKEFYLFNSEYLDAFFRTETCEKVKKAIRETADVGLLDRIIYHLGEYIKDLERESKKLLPPDQGKLIEEKHRIEKEIEHLTNLIEQDKTTIAEVKKKLEEIDKELKKYKGVDILVNERLELEERRKNINMKLENLKEEMNTIIFQLLIRVFLKEPVQEVLGIINEKTKTGELPPKIQKTFIKELLEKGECICGEKLDDKKREKLMRLLERVMEDEIVSQLTEGKYQLKNLLESIQILFQEKNKVAIRIRELEHELIEINEKLEEISHQLKEGKIEEEVRKLEIEREKYNELCDKLNQNIGYRKNEINSKLKRKTEIEEELNRILKKQEKAAEIRRKIELARKLLDAFKTLYDSVLKEIKYILEDRINKYFFSLVWKQESFKRVILTDDYEIKLMDFSDRDITDAISMGERELLSLSFMGTLRDISGYEFPVIMDNPLFRLSELHQKNLVEFLENVMKNRQAFLLLTDVEYHFIRDLIKDKKEWKVYKLNFDESKKECLIFG